MSISKYLRILSCTKFGSSSTFVNLWGKGSHGRSETKMSITHDRQRQERWACLYLHRWRGLVGGFVEEITCCNDLCETIRCLNSQHLTPKDLRIFVACLWFLHTKHRTLNFEYRKPVVWKGTWNGCIPKKVGWKTGHPPKKTGKVRPPFHLFNFWSSKDDNFFGFNTKSIQQRDVWWVVRDTDILTMEMMTSQGHLFHLSNLWLLNAFSWL